MSPGSPDPGLGHVDSLDGLRGLAVAAVVVFHFVPGWAPAGFVGVDLFFVLSGFLITTLLVQEHRRSGRIDAPAFWGRRVRRLLPAALLTIAAVVVVGAVWDANRGATTGEVIAALLYFTNWREILTDAPYFEALSAPSPLRHFWSLGIEEQFYLVWPVVVVAVALLVRRLRVSRHVLIALLSAGIVVSAAAMLVLYDGGAGITRAYYGTDSRAFQILAGALLAVVLRDTRTAQHRGWVKAAGVVAVAVLSWTVLFWEDPSGFYYRGGAVGIAVAGTAVIAACLAREGPVHRVLSLRPLVALGVVSYGVYLFHWPVFLWLDHGTTGLEGPVLFGVRVAVTVAVAVLSYRLLEQPIRQRRELGILHSPASLGLTAGGVAASVALLAVLLPGERLPLQSGPVVIERPSDLPDPPESDAVALADAVVLPASPRREWFTVSSADLEGGRLLLENCWPDEEVTEVRDHGAETTVAVIGDSVAQEAIDPLLSDPTYNWHAAALCGLSLERFDRDNPRNGSIQGDLDQLVEAEPDVLVIAVGSYEWTSTREKRREALGSLLAETDSIGCRLLMNVHPNPQVELADPAFDVDRMIELNEELAEAAAENGLRLLDWNASVEATGLTDDGYHPFLDPSDWYHLVPGQGDVAWVELVQRGVQTCEAPLGSERTSAVGPEG